MSQIKLGLPKGSLQESTFALMKKAGWNFKVGSRSYMPSVNDPDIAAPIRAAGAKALDPNLWPWFRRLATKRPTLLIRGATSDLLSPAIAERMRKAAPEMAFAEIPGVGHAPMLDEPEAKAAIFEFLAGLD